MAPANAGTPRSWEQYLLDSAVPRSAIDDFTQRPNWATFDPELGYTLHDCLIPWGAGDSRTIETFRPDGARSRSLYAGRKPRGSTPTATASPSAPRSATARST